MNRTRRTKRGRNLLAGRQLTSVDTAKREAQKELTFMGILDPIEWKVEG